MIEKITAYKVGNGAPLETNLDRAFAWIIENESKKKIGFTGALWIIENADEVQNILDSYFLEKNLQEKSKTG